MYTIGLVISNRASGASIRLDKPSEIYQVYIPNELPMTVDARAGQPDGRLLVSIETGISTTASDDNCIIPIVVAGKNGQSESGSIRIFTADGKSQPSLVVVELVVDEMSMLAHLSASGLDQFVSASGSASHLGDITFIFSDGGHSPVVSQRDIELTALELLVGLALA